MDSPDRPLAVSSSTGPRLIHPALAAIIQRAAPENRDGILSLALTQLNRIPSADLWAEAEALERDLAEWRLTPFAEPSAVVYQQVRLAVLQAETKRRQALAKAAGPKIDYTRLREATRARVAALKGRVDVRDVLEDLGWRPSGKLHRDRAWYHCPWHGEDKTPSGVVYPDNHWWCFGCGHGGDVITAIASHQAMGFLDAIAWLEQHYGA